MGYDIEVTEQLKESLPETDMRMSGFNDPLILQAVGLDTRVSWWAAAMAALEIAGRDYWGSGGRAGELTDAKKMSGCIR